VNQTDNAIMKRSVDDLIFGLILGSLFPAFFFLACLVLWFYLFQTVNPLYFVLPGLFTGLLIDLIFLKRLILTRYELPVWILICTYLFCNVVVYGLFMGFPVFNLLMGIIAGYYFGKRVRYKNLSLAESKPIIRQVSFFTSSIMFLICIASGYIATLGDGVGRDLEHMFRLNFEVTKAMIWAIIWIGGLMVIIAEFYLTKVTMIKTIK
jgi:hypothetical protein